MITTRKSCGIIYILFLVFFSSKAVAQPTLPDMVADEEDGIILLSWTCQYDGVKSIAVLRSADSNFNYSTIGFVKKLSKGVQAYADGHPLPGKNYYKLSIVFNSGLTWGSNHCGIYADSNTIRKSRTLPANDALQKLIVTEGQEKATAPKSDRPATGIKERYVNSAVAPADRDKYMEVVKKEPAKPVTDTKDTVIEVKPQRPQYKVKTDEEEDVDADTYMEHLPEEVKKKLTITYTDDSEEISADKYIDRPADKKKVNMTFEDKEDAAAFVATLPKAEQKKFTITYNIDTSEPNADNYIEGKKPEPAKKVTMTAGNNTDMQTLMERIPKDNKSKVTLSYNIDTADLHNKAIKEEVKKEAPVAPRQKIAIRFSDDMNVNEAADIKSKYIFNDAISGHVTMNLPEDISTHHYSIKFYDKEGHAVIEIPRINTSKIILDKRNFQKKGQYKFVLRRDVVELESGYINIY